MATFGTLDPSSIAVVIPVYDREHVIGRALDSVLSQRRRPDEILVIDDGSTDGTTEVVRSYGDTVRLLERPHRGVSVARNVGVNEATSAFVAFLDSDDFWEPDHLERMTEAIAATAGSASLYFSDLRLDPTYGGGSVWAQCGFEPNGPFELREADKEWLFASRQPIMIPASVVRRDDYVSVGGSDTRLKRRGDTHLIFKLGLTAAVCAVSGIAGECTAGAANSLTEVISPVHPVYLSCTILLYTDLLETFKMNRQQRNTLRRRVSASYVTRARQAGVRSPLAFVSHLSKATLYDPLWPVRRAGALTRRAVWPAVRAARTVPARGD
jgi:Glycosyl transferase family 2